jgi:hypothetical protein
MNLGRIFRRAKKVVDDRGGVDALKEDAKEVAAVAKGEGSMSDKARKASKVLSDPGAPGGEEGRAQGREPGGRRRPSSPP